jgi:hypothetical protein
MAAKNKGAKWSSAELTKSIGIRKYVPARRRRSQGGAHRYSKEITSI